MEIVTETTVTSTSRRMIIKTINILPRGTEEAKIKVEPTEVTTTIIQTTRVTKSRTLKERTSRATRITTPITPTRTRTVKSLTKSQEVDSLQIWNILIKLIHTRAKVTTQLLGSIEKTSQNSTAPGKKCRLTPQPRRVWRLQVRVFIIKGTDWTRKINWIIWVRLTVMSSSVSILRLMQTRVREKSL